MARESKSETRDRPVTTPAMISAGVSALYSADDATFSALSEPSVERIAVAAYEAMVAVSVATECATRERTRTRRVR